jgi:Tfp pilus assembly protein PilF
MEIKRQIPLPASFARCRATWTVCATLALLLVVTALGQDPVGIAPDAYKLTFENEYVRVQRVHYAPRARLPEHDHTAYGAAYVYLNDAGPVAFKHIGLSYGAVTRPAVKAGSFRLYKAVRETHAVENLSDTPSDFLRVEFKTEAAKDPNTLRGKFFRPNFTLDAPAGENFQTMQFENEQVRITRLLCAARKTCEHAATNPSLLVALTTARFRSGPGKPLRLAPGQTRWLDAGRRQRWENVGNEATEWLRFDFKTPPVKKAESEKPHVHPPGDAGRAEQRAEAAALLRRGAALEREGRLADSIAVHEQALVLDPGLVQAHLNLISLYGRAKQPEKAERHYRDALAINPDLPDIHYNFGVLLAGQERRREAAQAFQRCLQLNPHSAEAHVNYAVLIEGEGRLDEAAAHYRKAIENKAGYAAAHFHLGRILVNQEKLAEAIAQFRLALEPEDAETPRYLYALGATIIRAGDKPNGIRHLREALKRASALNQTQLVASLERDLKSLGQGN